MFSTQRAPGSTFRFEIQGDSHPERPRQFSPRLYAQTLRAAAADRPDFYLTSGDALPNSGRVRVTVAPEQVTVDYLRSWLPKDASAAHPDGEIATSYSVAARARETKVDGSSSR